MYFREQSVAHKIIDALDVIAKDVSRYEFGLPIHEPHTAQMLDAVNEILEEYRKSILVNSFKDDIVQNTKELNNNGDVI